jgi:hypothetical protein
MTSFLLSWPTRSISSSEDFIAGLIVDSSEPEIPSPVSSPKPELDTDTDTSTSSAVPWFPPPNEPTGATSSEENLKYFLDHFSAPKADPVPPSQPLVTTVTEQPSLSVNSSTTSLYATVANQPCPLPVANQPYSFMSFTLQQTTTTCLTSAVMHNPFADSSPTVMAGCESPPSSPPSSQPSPKSDDFSYADLSSCASSSPVLQESVSPFMSFPQREAETTPRTYSQMSTRPSKPIDNSSDWLRPITFVQVNTANTPNIIMIDPSLSRGRRRREAGSKRKNVPSVCGQCGVSETPEWRRGPDGPRT